MNKDIKKYFKECKYLFSSYGKREKEYIKRLKDNLDIENNTMTYNDIVDRLGTPKEIIIDYYEQENVYNLIKKARFSKILKIFLIIILIITTLFFAYRSYIYQKEYDEITNSSNGYFETVIE